MVVRGGIDPWRWLDNMELASGITQPPGLAQIPSGTLIVRVDELPELLSMHLGARVYQAQA